MDAIPILRSYMKPQHNYLEINSVGNIVLSPGESRPFLASLGISGEIVSTPGHSDDSITLVLDEGVAFTGDLTPAFAATEDKENVIRESWEKIRSLGAKTIYPGHGPVGRIQTCTSHS